MTDLIKHVIFEILKTCMGGRSIAIVPCSEKLINVLIMRATVA